MKPKMGINDSGKSNMAGTSLVVDEEARRNSFPVWGMKKHKI